MKKLAIVTTHPIQYYVPLFKLLSKENIILKVFYTWGKQSVLKYDPGFKRTIQWDIPLLDGYDYEFLNNSASKPGSHHFNGIINPDAIKRIEAFEPNAILIFGWSYNSHLKILRYFKGKVPLWFRGDSTLLDGGSGLRNTIKFAFLRWIYSCVDLVFYVGQNNRRYFEACGFQKHQLSFAPHAIENERFSNDHHVEAGLLRKGIGVKEKDILILFAGKFEEKKDPLLLLEAFVDLAEDSTHLLLVGNGPLETSLKDRAKKYTSRIHFMEFQNQKSMPVIYQACDLFCLPSKGPGETWGLAINEAMAAGKAILISDKVGCGEDLVQRGINGEIFKRFQ